MVKKQKELNLFSVSSCIKFVSQSVVWLSLNERTE